MAAELISRPISVADCCPKRKWGKEQQTTNTAMKRHSNNASIVPSLHTLCLPLPHRNTHFKWSPPAVYWRGKNKTKTQSPFLLCCIMAAPLFLSSFTGCHFKASINKSICILIPTLNLLWLVAAHGSHLATTPAPFLPSHLPLSDLFCQLTKETWRRQVTAPKEQTCTYANQWRWWICGSRAHAKCVGRPRVV